MKSDNRYRRGRREKPEEPDWRTRESRGHTWFTNMQTERDKRLTGIIKSYMYYWIGAKFCQRCFSHDHFTYQCKNERVYQQRPSETQIV